jgi:hypothetical protein
MRLRNGLLVAALAAMGLAGCGGTTVTKTLSATVTATATSTAARASVTSSASTTSTAAATPTQTTSSAPASSPADFKRAFAAQKVIFTKLGSDLAKSVEGAGSKSNSALAVEFESLSSRAAQQAVRLAKLDPPAKYLSDLAGLTSGFASVAADLTAISTAAAAGNPPAAKAATTKLLRDAATVKAHDNSLTASLGIPQTG